VSTEITPSRRERRHRATLDEIVAVARSLLREPGGISLRAVAQRMGMTAPALYRYVDDLDALMMLVADSIDAETAATLRTARDAHPEDDPVARTVAAVAAFRHWALTRREEFSHVFANPARSWHDDQPNEECGLVLTELVVRIWEQYGFDVPAATDLDPSVIEAFSEGKYAELAGDVPPESLGVFWVVLQAWVELYGTLALEVFGHCDARLVESGVLFRAMLARQAEILGIADQLARLQPLIDGAPRRGGGP